MGPQREAPERQRAKLESAQDEQSPTRPVELGNANCVPPQTVFDPAYTAIPHLEQYDKPADESSRQILVEQ
jgi:hypothetical protein